MAILGWIYGQIQCVHGEPLPGASASLSYHSECINVANAQGYYLIAAPHGTYDLTVSLANFTTQVISVNITEGWVLNKDIVLFDVVWPAEGHLHLPDEYSIWGSNT